VGFERRLLFGVELGVCDGVGVEVVVCDGVDVEVGVCDGVGVGVGVCDGVGVEVVVCDGVGVEVVVCDGVGVEVVVCDGVGVEVDSSLGVDVGAGVNPWLVAAVDPIAPAVPATTDITTNVTRHSPRSLSLLTPIVMYIGTGFVSPPKRCRSSSERNFYFGSYKYV
jgi:hypothetical protein